MTILTNDTGFHSDTGQKWTDTGVTPVLEMTKGQIQTRGTWAGTLYVQTAPSRLVDTGTGDTGMFTAITQADGTALAYTANINIGIDALIPTKARLYWVPSDTGAELIYTMNGVNPPASG